MVKYRLVFVRPLSELHLSSRATHITDANMAVTLAQFLWSLQSEGKWIKRAQNHSSVGMLRAAAQQTHS